ncbi:MAG: amidohydrolase family protein [Phycisphaerales bacterium]
MTSQPPGSPPPPERPTPLPRPLPPLRESHAHLAMLGRSLTMLSLADCTSLEECLERVRGASGAMDAHTGREQWVLACSMRVEGWREPRWPTRQELDAVSPDRPIALMSFDHHSVAANSAAMRAAGLHDGAPDPEGGVVVRDRAGLPTGVLLESAAKRVWNAAPEPGPAERAGLVRSALRHLHALGYREVHDLLSPAWLGPLLAELSDAGELLMPVGLYPLLPELAQQVDAARAYARPGVRLMGGKVFADGTLNSRTAWMLDPYADGDPSHPRGLALMHEPALRGAMERAAGLGQGLAVHAIGDGAVRATLDAWEASALWRGGPARLRIEHCEVIDDADVPRFAQLGVVCSVQPCHLLADMEVLDRALPHRLDRVLPLRDLVDSGCVPGDGLVFGSDVPIVRADPGDSLQGAVERRRAGMAASCGIGLRQAVTAEEAVRALRC